MARSAVIGARAGTASRYGWTLPPIPNQASPSMDAVQVGDVGATATALVQEAADATASVFVEKMGEYRKLVQKDWPVKSGYSQSRFTVEIQAGGAAFMVSLKNDANYSGRIRQKGYSPENPAVRIVFDHADKLADIMAADLAAYLAVV